ncbi:MAG: hypothetical protein IK127_07915 [Clostridia bacterium]|nr:hypothetical protein [Clostridia bacterium]
MKKEYVGLKAEKIDFGAYNMVTVGSLPAGCIQIVANQVDPGASTCNNPTDTTSYMYLNNKPSNFPD